MIQMKTSVEKPVEQPYFISESLTVASWFYYKAHLFVPNVFSLSLVKVETVDGRWVTTPVEPYVECENMSVSPQFSSAPVTIYGTIDVKDISPGTRYYRWFNPSEIRVTEDTFGTEQYDAKVTVPTNLWLPYSLFKNWVKI